MATCAGASGFVLSKVVDANSADLILDYYFIETYVRTFCLGQIMLPKNAMTKILAAQASQIK